MSNQPMQQSQVSSAREPDPDAIKMFVGQIPRSWGEAECRELFEQFGSVCQLNVLRDKVTQASRGCCFVTYYKRADAIAAQAALHNIRVLPQMYHPVQMKPADIENRNERKLFVGMLNKKLTEDSVREMFAQFGHIEDCTVLKDSEGKSRGCAFVTFAHRSCAQQAIRQVHLSQTMEGCSKPIVVKFADTQKEKDAKKSGGTPAVATPSLQNTVSLANTLQQLLQTTQPNSSTSPALGTQLAALAALLQTASQPNVLSLLGNAALQQQQHQQLAALQQQQRLLELLTHQQLANTPISTSSGSFGNDSKINGTAGGNNLIQLTGQNTSSSIDALQQAYAGLQQFAGLYPQLSADNLLTASSVSNTGVSTAGSGQSKGPDGCNLFIYHLPQDFTDNDLYTTFSPFGSIISAKVFIDKQTNLSKCFGFVSYDNVVSAQNAISALNGFQIGSKRLKVQLKRGKDNKPYPSIPVTSNSGNTKPLST
ncbi:hypothetical protein, variant [Loa loa]|uniref:RRM domain-containing protein n=1 Tax=Loa loa TaxID=7209 RepID=A0A1S0UKW8_LOALO|nr:hypothetical protein, variant [Loa loa]EJD76121.1 hypothetical protein, variant [Loa loa]